MAAELYTCELRPNDHPKYEESTLLSLLHMRIFEFSFVSSGLFTSIFLKGTTYFGHSIAAMLG